MCRSGCPRLHVSSSGWSEWRVNLPFFIFFCRVLFPCFVLFCFFSSLLYKAGIDECRREYPRAPLPLWHGTPGTLTHRLLRHQALSFRQRGKILWSLTMFLLFKWWGSFQVSKCSTESFKIHSRVAALAERAPFSKHFSGNFLQFFASSDKPNCVSFVAMAWSCLPMLRSCRACFPKTATLVGEKCKRGTFEKDNAGVWWSHTGIWVWEEDEVLTSVLFWGGKKTSKWLWSLCIKI